MGRDHNGLCPFPFTIFCPWLRYIGTINTVIFVTAEYLRGRGILLPETQTHLMIIISNKQRLDQKRAKNIKPTLLFLGVLLVIIILLAIFFPPFRYLAFMAFIPFLGLLGKFAKPWTYFELYTDEQQGLHFVFTDNNEATGNNPRGAIRRSSFRPRQERMFIQPGTLWGYESHSFITKEQQLIFLLLRTREGVIKTRSIPVEYLNEQEKAILYLFLDSLIAHNKRLAGGSTPDRTPYPIH